MVQLLRKALIFLLGFTLGLAVLLRSRYGGGKPYPGVTGTARFAPAVLETVVACAEPIGNVAVAEDGRIFFTLHPEARPDSNKLVEWKDGRAVPFPNRDFQGRHFRTPLGLFIDRQNRLWVIDHGFHGLRKVRLSAFDLQTGELVHDFVFPSSLAPFGSFLQDLQVDARGEKVYLADASIVRQKPALVIYNVARNRARRVLESHPSVYPQEWIIRNPIKEMKFWGGLVTLKIGVDGIALDKQEEWLYYAAMTHDRIYRVRTRDLNDESLSPEELDRKVEEFGRKPLSDGLSLDLEGNVYMTDVEHGAILTLAQNRTLTTLIKDQRLRWPDALSFGPDGWLYIADSAIPELLLHSKAHIRAHAPYCIFRFQPGTLGVPGG